MQKLFNFLSEYIATVPVFFLLVFVLFVCISIFDWRAKELKLGTEKNNKLLDIRFWYTPQDVREFFTYIDKNIGRVGLNLYALTQVTLDVIFPIAYGTLFIASIALLYSSEINWKLAIPLILVFADLSENFILAFLAQNYNKFSFLTPLAWLASLFTLIKWVMFFAASTLIIVGAIFGVFSDSWRVFLQYIFWLRVPISFGLIFYFLPIVANTIAAKLIQNLFVIRNRWQLIAVMISSTMAALMISLASEAILENAPARFIQLYSFINISPIHISTVQRYFLTLMLLLPTWIITFWLSLEIDFVIQEEKLLLNNKTVQERKVISEFSSLVGGQKKIVSGFFWGLLASLTFVAIVHLGGAVLKTLLNAYPNWESLIAKIINYLTLGYSQGYLDNGKIAEQHLLGLALALLGFLIYLLIGYLFKPGRKHILFIQNFIKNREAPALIYALFLIWIVTGVFSGVTFYLDLFSIPIILLFAGISALGYLIINVDHYFKLEKISQNKIKQSRLQQNDKEYKKILIPLEQLQTKEQKEKKLGEFATAIHNRLSKQPIELGRTLVVVATSGGGIQASGWTAQVLGGLQQELGSSFTQATGLISSVSGGSVGTMYFLDRFTRLGFPSENDSLSKIFKNATEDWLDAVGWGIAYPDLLRLTGWLSVLVNKYNDRGYALEYDWQMKMRHPEVVTTLIDWREKVINGEIPIPVFNSTLVEDGRRFLISPMKFVSGTIEEIINSDSDRKVLDFLTLYAGYDLKTTTAARLSATFPYVSPLPRNDPGICIALSDGKKFYGNYHFADGGYFDNSGLFTAVEWIDRGLTSFLKDLQIERILLLEINASPESQFKKGDKSRKWFMQSIGPLKTAYAVRDSTLVARNLKEAKLLAEKWKGKVDIRHFMISFPKGYEQPLSWRLTQKQKNNLKRAWEDVKKTETFNDLLYLWTGANQDEWNIPQQWQ